MFLLEKKGSSVAEWGSIPVLPTLGRQRREDQEFKAVLGLQRTLSDKTKCQQATTKVLSNLPDSHKTPN